MSRSNLPPGVSESSIPGNRPEDLEWEKFHEEIDDDTSRLGLRPSDARLLWKCALATLPMLEEEMSARYQMGFEDGARRGAHDASD